MKRINKIIFFCFLIFTTLFCMFFPVSLFAQDNTLNKSLTDAITDARKNARRGAILNAQSAAAASPGKVPGIERQVAVVPKTAGDALSNFNILKTVIINPATGQISFIGTYDPKYATGAIDYGELLKDAMESPYPWFSLGDINDVANRPKEYASVIDADMKKMWDDPNYGVQWINKIIALIMTNNSFIDDKTLFVAKLSRDFGITEEELVEMYKSNQPGAESSATSYRGYGKMMNTAGYPDIGEAMASSAEGTPEGLQRCMDILGISAQVSDIKGKMGRGEISYAEAHKQVSLLFTVALMERLGIPKEQVAQYANMVRSGQMPMEKMTAIMDERAQSVMTAVFGEQAFNNIVLSGNLLAAIYPSCRPDEINLLFKNIPPNSYLAKIMYEADYSLKLLNGPSMVRLFPDQVGEIQFHALRNALPEKQMSSTSMLNRYWLSPGASSMKISPDKKVISFGDATVIINEENVQAQGNFASQSHKESIKAYAAYLSSRYEVYAAKIPSFHELREALKVLALARWLKSQNINISIPASQTALWNSPKTAPSRFYAMFTVEDHRPFFTIAVGGVDFSGGDQWINTSSDKQVEVKALDQLKTSAYLGNKAVDATINGDMESARALAEDSAKALTGELDISKIRASPAGAATGDSVTSGTATPEQAELYKALSKDANDNINAISSGASPEAKDKALANLEEVKKIYNQAQKSPDKSDELLANYNASKTTTPTTPTQVASVPGTSTPSVPTPHTPTTVTTTPVTPTPGSSHISTSSQTVPPPPLPNVPAIFVPVPGISNNIFNDIKNIDPYDNPLVRFLDSPKTGEWIDAIGYQIKQIPSKAFDLVMEVVGLDEYYKVIKINKGLSEEVTKQMDLFMDAANKGFPEDDVKKLQERNNMTAGIAIEELSGMPMPVYEEKESGWHQWFQKKIKKND